MAQTRGKPARKLAQRHSLNHLGRALETQDVTLHTSCFPDATNARLRRALRERRVPGSLHYQSAVQAQHWLDLHRKYSPSRADASCAAAYDAAFRAAAEILSSATETVVVGLGCGGGTKDARLLAELAKHGPPPASVPTDVGLPMVIMGAQAARAAAPAADIHPLVIDLLAAENASSVLAGLAGPAPRVLTFFGLIPNFEPQAIMPRLAALVRPGDLLLFSANLAPGLDYRAGTEAILPQYDNPETRAWLSLFLKDVGLQPERGELRFGVAPCPSGAPFQRVEATWEAATEETIRVLDEPFTFHPGNPIELFFSYRHTPSTIRGLLTAHDLVPLQEWTAAEGQEGIFLCQRLG